MNMQRATLSMLLIWLDSMVMNNQSRGWLFLKKERMMRTSLMTDRLWMLNKIIKLATTPTSSHWLGQKKSNYKKRWIYSLIVMSMYLLRIIYYLIVVHYLCSGLKNMQCLTRLLRVQRKATWRRRVAVSDSDFQVRDEFCTNPRSFTLSILYHWRHLEVYFPTQ